MHCFQFSVDVPFEVSCDVAGSVLAIGVNIGGPMDNVAGRRSVEYVVVVLGIGILLSTFDPGNAKIPGGQGLKTQDKR